MAANAIIDELCRDVNDGAYHCPECDVPFTRRSNLRRHYKMHTRNLEEKRCILCQKLFDNSGVFAQHMLRCSSEHLFKQRSGQAENADHGLFVPTHCGTAVAGTTGVSNSPTPPTPPFDAGLIFGENRPGAGGFTHAGRGETERLQDEFVRLLSPLMSDTDTPSPISPTIDSHTSHSSFGMVSMVPPCHVGETVNLSSVASLDQLGTRPRSGSRSSRTYMSGSLVQRRRSKEKPVYTRRQVEDMLHVVSHSLMRALVGSSSHATL